VLAAALPLASAAAGATGAEPAAQAGAAASGPDVAPPEVARGVEGGVARAAGPCTRPGCPPAPGARPAGLAGFAAAALALRGLARRRSARSHAGS